MRDVRSRMKNELEYNWINEKRGKLYSVKSVINIKE